MKWSTAISPRVKLIWCLATGADHSSVASVKIHQFDRTIVQRNLCPQHLHKKEYSKKNFCCSSCPSPPEPCGWSFFNSDAPNANILYGALVGGPNLQDEYEDIRNDAVRNEVAVDYNAAFQGAVAALQELTNSGFYLNYQVPIWLGIIHAIVKLVTSSK